MGQEITITKEQIEGIIERVERETGRVEDWTIYIEADTEDGYRPVISSAVLCCETANGEIQTALS